MDKSKIILPLLVIGAIVFFYFAFNTHNTPTTTLKIGSWYINNFNENKTDVQSLTDYSIKIKDYDIFFIQGITQQTSTPLDKLCNLLRDYNCQITPMDGITDKEQYAIIYKKTLMITGFNPLNGIYERHPYRATFNFSNSTLNLITINPKMSNVKIELMQLQNVTISKSIILGNLYGDCVYYQQGYEFTNWTWLIKSFEKTSNHQSNCAYDRIIVSPDISSNIKDFGIDSDFNSNLSEHYIVWFKYTFKNG